MKGSQAVKNEILQLCGEQPFAILDEIDSRLGHIDALKICVVGRYVRGDHWIVAALPTSFKLH